MVAVAVAVEEVPVADAGDAGDAVGEAPAEVAEEDVNAPLHTPAPSMPPIALLCSLPSNNKNRFEYTLPGIIISFQIQTFVAVFSSQRLVGATKVSVSNLAREVTKEDVEVKTNNNWPFIHT